MPSVFSITNKVGPPLSMAQGTTHNEKLSSFEIVQKALRVLQKEESPIEDEASPALVLENCDISLYDFMSVVKTEYVINGCFTNPTLGFTTLFIPESVRLNITDKDLIEMLKFCPHLTSLAVENCPNVTGAFLAHLPSTIRRLNLSGCYKIKNAQLNLLAGINEDGR